MIPFKVGDRVVVIDKDSLFYDRSGTVLRIDPPHSAWPIMVRLASKERPLDPISIGFSERDLALEIKMFDHCKEVSK